MRRVMYILLVVIILLLILFVPFEQPKMIEMEDNGTEYEIWTPKLPEENLSETYPEHPTLADCENTIKWRFCIGDVAEMTNNISLCYMIDSPDIRFFCVARISLNETMCMDIIDEGLREACLESIHMKKS